MTARSVRSLQAELKRVREALASATVASVKSELYGAQQALSWALGQNAMPPAKCALLGQPSQTARPDDQSQVDQSPRADSGSTRIWKYTLLVTDEQFVSMPAGAILLDVQTQHGEPQLWAQVDPAAPRVTRKVGIFGTGNPMPDEPGAYVASFQLHGGDIIVFHVFDGGES